MRKLALILTLILLSLLASCIEPEQVAEDNLAPYKQSLLPAFQGDIAPLGEIPRYRIVVGLDSDALILTGRQQVLYTNNEGSKLGEIYFRLYPNLPQFRRGSSAGSCAARDWSWERNRPGPGPGVPSVVG